TICLKCLNKLPAQRYQSAAELSQDLVRWIEGKPVHARPTSRIERLWRSFVKSPALVQTIASTVASILAIVMLISGFAFFSDRLIDPGNLDIDSAFVRRFWMGFLVLILFLFNLLAVLVIRRWKPNRSNTLSRGRTLLWSTILL